MNIRPARSLLLCLLVCVIACAAPARAGEEDPGPDARDRVALLLKNGDYAAAADILLELHKQDPGDRRVHFDVVAALAWSDRYEEAAALALDFIRLAPPRYSLAAAALAFRRVGDFPEAIQLYESGEQRYPNDNEFFIGHALTLADAGRFIETADRLEDTAARFGESGAVEEARRYLAHWRGEAEYSAARDRAANLARGGRHDEALELLRTLREQRPEDAGNAYDMLLTLSWAARHAEAAEIARSIDLAAAPEYIRREAAFAFRESGDFDAAEKLYRELLAARPGNPELVEALTATLLRAEKPEAAEALAKESGVDTLEKQRVYLRRDEAGVLAAEGRFAEALEALNAVAAEHPGYEGVDHDRLAVSAWSGRYDEAAAIADRVNLSGAPLYVKDAAALAYRETKRYDKAKTLYRELLAQDAENAEAAAGLTRILLEERRADEAEEVLTRYLARDAKRFPPLERQLVMLRRDEAATAARAEKYDEAIHRLRELRAKRPGHVGVEYDLLAILSWARNFREAAELARGMDLGSAPGYVREAAATAFREVREYARAAELYLGLVEEQPADAAVAEGLIGSYIRMGRLNEAERGLAEYRARTGDAAALPAVGQDIITNWRLRAATLARSGNHDAAIDILRRRHAEHPANTGVLHDLVAILVWAERNEDAAALADTINPASAPDYVLSAAASALRKTNRLPEALRMYRIALKRFPGRADLVVGLAMAMGDSGDREGGAALLDAFAAKNPGPLPPGVAEARRYLNPPGSYTPPPPPDTPYRKTQEAIVVRAREGDAKALAEMAELHRLHPDDQYVTGDFIVLLQWAKENERVISLAGGLDLRFVQPHVADAVYRALCVMGKHYAARRFAELVIGRQNGNPEMRAALAVSLARAGDIGTALDWLDEAEATRAGGIGNRVAEAKRLMRHDIIEAAARLEESNRALRAGPDDAPARRRKIDALEALNARILAREEMLLLPESFLPPERRRDIHYAAARNESSWGEEYGIPGGLNARTRIFVKAMEKLDALLAGSDCAEAPEFINRVEAAKVKVFYEMNMFREAVNEYLHLCEKGWRMPTGTLLSAAGAFLGIRRPAQAKAVYLQILERGVKGPVVATAAELPENVREEDLPVTVEELYEAKKGLFWALLENEELGSSLARAQFNYYEGVRLDDRPKGLYRNDDWRAMDVTANRSHAHLYTNFMADAEAQLRALTAEAPAHAAGLAALASAQGMRGLPRTANKTVKRAQIFAPGDVGLATQEAGTYLGHQNWRPAHRLVLATNPYIPKVAGARRLQRDWETYNCYEFRWDVAWSKMVDGVGRVSGGGGDPTVEARLFSRPICYNWRVFAGAGTSAGDFDEGHARQTRYLGGVEYRDEHMTVSLEARADKVRDREYGLALYGQFTPDDHWRIPFNFETLSRDTPLRARYSGITAAQAAAGVSYYWNEIKSFNSMFSFMDFSDGNRRVSAGADFNHRLHTCFNRYIDGRISAYASTNSEDAERPYFNPESDVELGGALSYGNLLWRRYERSLRHLVTVGAGNYWQKNYGSDIVWNIEYSHSWEWGDRLSVAYGVGYGRRVYDGDPERTVNAWLSGVYRF